MNLTVNAKDFKTALDHVQSAAPKRTTMPILQNAFFQSIDKEKVKITTNDLKQQISYTLECENSGDMFTTIEFDKLFKLVSKYKDDQTVKLSVSEGSALVKCANSRGKLKIMPANEYPVQQANMDNMHSIFFEGSELVEAISKASSMAGQNDVRSYLNGVALDIKPEYTNVVATDGHRLIKIRLECTNESQLDRTIIIPNEAVSGFVKSLDEQPVSMNIANNFVQFADEVIEFQSQLLDGKYPDYNRVIPRDNDKDFTFIGAEFKDAISRVTTFGDGKNTPVAILVNDGVCSLTVSGGDNTQGDEIVNCISNHNIEIGVNAKYMTDTISKVNTDDITVWMKDQNTAMFIKDENTEITIMPMRL